MEDIFELSKFDEYKEDNRREVKAAEGGLPQSLWDTYSSMANTYGGVIICGVRERQDGTWYTTGMKDASKLKRNFWNQANDQKKVSINLLHESAVSTYEVGEDVILVIEVPMADRETKPVYINGDMFRGTFKRTAEGDYHCTAEEEQFGAGLPDRTTLTLPLINKMKDLSEMKQDFLPQSPEKSPEKSPETKANEIDARKEAVLSLIMENPSLSKSKIARKLGISDRQVRTVLDYLKAEGKIHYEGASRGGRWVID